MNSSKEVIGLIKKLRERREMSAEELAHRVGVAKSTQSRYENEKRTFPINEVGKYADALGTSIEYLLGIKGGMTKAKNSMGLITNYPFYPVSIAAGLPTSVEFMSVNDVETIEVPDTVMGKWAGANVFITKVNGESMNRVIPDQSIIAVHPVELSTLKDNDIVVFSDNHEYSVKRFYDDKENKRVVFRPDSKDNRFIDYSLTYSETDNLVIHGKVVVYVVELH